MRSLANDWLFSRTVHLGDNLCSTYKVQPGDVLANVAAKFKVPYQFLMKINNISSDKIPAGRTDNKGCARSVSRCCLSLIFHNGPLSAEYVCKKL